MRLNLGFVYTNGVLVNHRSLFKLFTNPFLRIFGREIATKTHVSSFTGDEHVIGYEIQKTKIRANIFANIKETWCYELKDNQTVKKRNIWL